MKKTLSFLLAGFGVLSLNACSSNTATPTASVTASPAEVAASPVEVAAKPSPSFDKKRSRNLDDTARLLAGMDVANDSPFVSVEKTATWKNHANFLSGSWAQLDKQQLAKVRAWSDRELKTINSTSPNVFYPFSGPDFLYAYSLFPRGREYVMIGLEPVGNIPDFSKLSDAGRNAKIIEARDSLYALLKFSFFRTNDMKVDMAQQGVIPVLFLFLARTGNQILDARLVGVNSTGKIGNFTKGMTPGVKITFLPKNSSNPRDLYYFSTDISNDGLKKNPGFVKFIKDYKQPVTYLKAASYLMHYGSFSTIRELILSGSQNLLQDDSGIPLRYFDKNTWNLTFFGVYSSPIALFADFTQADLRKVYQGDKNIKPLNFGIGYRFGKNDSNLMLAKRK